MENKTCSRKVVKQLIKSEIDGVEFHKPKRVNESERVTIKDRRDTAVQLSEQEHDVKDEMKTLYDAATHLRKSITKSKKWVFHGSLETLCKDYFPEELLILLFQMGN